MLYFNKHYQFKRNNEWKLPEKVFTCEEWSIEKLQTKKHVLNSVKEQLNQFDLDDWSKHTKHRDPSTMILQQIRHKFNPELLTQAWCKFFEILSKFDNLIACTNDGEDGANLQSLHLCEAPGGFITALNHYLANHHPDIKLEWKATTLNPYYEGNSLDEMIPDDRLIAYTQENWIFGEDNTGDLTNYRNYCHLLEQVGGDIGLVTADGSINCIQDPGNQERHVEWLHFCETVTALSVLNEGGNFVLKIFTAFEPSTICLLYLLNCAFDEVHIFKPITSKSGNSEMYVIALRYHQYQLLHLNDDLVKHYEKSHIAVGGGKAAMFTLDDLNNDFLAQIDEANTLFMRSQIRTIKANIASYNTSMTHTKLRTNHRIAEEFFKRYKVRTLDKGQRIVPEHNINNNLRYYCGLDVDIYESREYQCSDNDTSIILDIQFAKRFTRLLNSLYCNNKSVDLIYESCKRREPNSYFNNIASNCRLIQADANDNQIDLQNVIFNQIYDAIKSNNVDDILLINTPLLSGFLVQLLFLLSRYCTITSFHRNTGIHMLQFRKKPELVQRLDEIVSAMDELNTDTTMIHSLFNHRIIDRCFSQCIWFYNANLTHID